MNQQTKLECTEDSLKWADIGSKKPKAEWSNDQLLVVFESDAPVELPSKFDGRRLWLFDVEQFGEKRIFMTSSIRLAAALKKLGSFANKPVSIKRFGKGLNLSYTAEFAK